MSTSLHGKQLVLVVVVLLLTAGRGLKTWSVVVTTRKQSLLLHHHPHHPQVKLLTTLYMSEQVIDTRWRDCLQDSLTGNATNFKEAMGVLKTQHGLAKHWSSTVLEPTQVSKAELKLITRTSFPQREDLLADLLTSMLPSKGQDPFIKLTSFNIATLIFIIGFSITSFADDSLFPQSVRNLLGLFTLAFPFLFIGIGIIAPGLVQSWDKQLESKRLQTLASTGLISEEEKDRILFHEAGHFLLGYLCGIPVVDYDISGDQDSGVSILAEIPGIMRNPQQGEVVQVLESKQAGGLLVVAVAGVVSEMLQFGNAFGGKQDFPLACEILRIYLHSQDHQKYSLQKGVDIEDEKTIALLRWAIMKAISLLRLHNRELKVVVQCMRERRSVIDCLAAIEQAAPSSQ